LLEGFLRLLDRKPGKKAVKLRHVSWVGDDVFELLKQHNVAFVVSHGDNYPLVTTPTADFMYVSYMDILNFTGRAILSRSSKPGKSYSKMA